LVAILKQKDIEIVGEAPDGEQTCKLHQELSPRCSHDGSANHKKDGLQVVRINHAVVLMAMQKAVR